MKKSLFLAPLFMAAFASCSSEDVASESNGMEQTSGVSYLSVNIMNTPSTGGGAGAKGITRANGYENGSAAENTVGKVRFYFFNEDGTAAKVKGQAGATFLDYTPGETANGTPDNIEKRISATLVIESDQGDKIPASIIAVLNPVSTLGEVTSIDDLNGKVYGEFRDAAGNFVMSNSIYANDGEKMEAVSVKGKLFDNSVDAKANPVTIHVERQAAKVRVQNSLAKAAGATVDGIYSTASEGNNNILVEENEDGSIKTTEIFVKFLGWNTTTTADQSYLMKSINPAWSATLFGDEPWNNAAYFRSYWAINPTDVGYSNFKFNIDDFSANANKFYDPAATDNAGAFTYVHENAEGSTKNTQVIIAAQLCDKDGNSITLAEWGGIKYSVSDLKKAMMTQTNIYKKVTEGGVDKYVRLAPDDLVLKTATEMAEDNVAPATGRYLSYVQLAETITEIYNGAGASAQAMTVAAANEVLKNLGGAKVWETGFTYYYFDLKHFGDMFGVVRNHIYNANIKTLVGLGTPVYNPDEVIIPEHPEDDKTYIAAEINILSWRVVDQDVNLNW